MGVLTYMYVCTYVHSTFTLLSNVPYLLVVIILLLWHFQLPQNANWTMIRMHGASRDSTERTVCSRINPVLSVDLDSAAQFMSIPVECLEAIWTKAAKH